MKLHGHSILITGGSSGIGLELARQLAGNNTVIICGRNQQRLDDTVKQIPGVHTFRCDVSNDTERTNLFSYLQQHHPEVDVLINNAAIVHKTDFLADAEMVNKARAEIDVNLLAPVALTKKFLSMRPVAATVINITSGLVFAPRAVYPIYNATKSALHAFTRVLRHQVRNRNIRVIEVLMPVVDTPWHKDGAPKIAIPPAKAVGEMIASIAKGRLEVRVGAVKLLHVISRLSPRLAFRLINRIE